MSKHSIVPSPAWTLTRCELGVFHLPVVGAAALVEARVHRGAAVAQSARAAAHGGVRGVKVLGTLEAIVVVPVGVEPAVAVLALRVRDAQVPREVSEQQAAQQTHHPGEPQRSTPDGVTRSACVTLTARSSCGTAQQTRTFAGFVDSKTTKVKLRAVQTSRDRIPFKLCYVMLKYLFFSA